MSSKHQNTQIPLELNRNIRPLVRETSERQRKKFAKLKERRKAVEELDEKNKSCSCCPNSVIFCSCKLSSCCCRFTIFYYYLFILTVLMSVGLHIFDVGSDIFVLTDLYNTNIEFFFNCLGIMILSFIASSLISLVGKSDGGVEPGTYMKSNIGRKSCKYKLLDSVLGFFQLSIFNEVYHSIDIEEKTHTFQWSRIIEAILESCPQALFQLFIVFRNIDTSDIMDLSKYYVSITISLLNLAMALVTFEIYRYEYERRKGRIPIRGVEKLTIFSNFGIVLGLYRFTEVCSRIGLLACLGYMYDGRAILMAIGTDYILSVFLGFIYEKCINKRSFRYCMDSIYIFGSKLLFLPVYWKPFTTKMPGDTTKAYYADLHYWLIKYTQNTVISVLIILNLINSNYHQSINIISIASIACFILNIPLLYFIILWNRNTIFTKNMLFIRDCWCKKKNHKDKFESYSFSMNCCCIVDKNITIENDEDETRVNVDEFDTKEKNSKLESIKTMNL